MGVKTELISEVSQEIAHKVTLTAGVGVASAGANNKFQFIPDLTLDEWALWVGIVTTLIGLGVTLFLKFEARTRRNRLYDLVEQRYKRTGEIPKEIFDEDNKEGSSLL